MTPRDDASPRTDEVSGWDQGRAGTATEVTTAPTVAPSPGSGVGVAVGGAGVGVAGARVGVGVASELVVEFNVEPTAVWTGATVVSTARTMVASSRGSGVAVAVGKGVAVAGMEPGVLVGSEIGTRAVAVASTASTSGKRVVPESGGSSSVMSGSRGTSRGPDSSWGSSSPPAIGDSTTS